MSATANGAVVPAPGATPKQTDPHTGFSVLEQPIAIEASSPMLADGTPLTAVQSFLYGVLLYQIDAFGSVQIYDGNAFTAEPAFNFLLPSLKPVELAFDTASNSWKGTFVLAIVAATNPAFTLTDPATHRPSYGFLTVLRIPRKVSPTATISASRSPLAPPFGVISAADTTRVKVAPLQGLNAVQDMSKADGFAIYAKDASMVPVAQLICSANGSVPPGVTLEVYQSGNLRASITADSGGSVTVTAATRATIQAPIIEVKGELRAQNVFYEPFDGSPGRYL